MRIYIDLANVYTVKNDRNFDGETVKNLRDFTRRFYDLP